MYYTVSLMYSSVFMCTREIHMKYTAIHHKIHVLSWCAPQYMYRGIQQHNRWQYILRNTHVLRNVLWHSSLSLALGGLIPRARSPPPLLPKLIFEGSTVCSSLSPLTLNSFLSTPVQFLHVIRRFFELLKVKLLNKHGSTQ